MLQTSKHPFVDHAGKLSHVSLQHGVDRYAVVGGHGQDWQVASAKCKGGGGWQGGDHQRDLLVIFKIKRGQNCNELSTWYGLGIIYHSR